MEKMHFRCPACNQKLFATTKDNLFPINIKIHCVKCDRVFAFVPKLLDLNVDIKEIVSASEDGMSNDELANLLEFNRDEE